MHVSVDGVKKSEESAHSDAMASEEKKAATSSSFVDGFISDFASVGKVHEQFLDGLADSRIGMLKELPQIDAETFERILDSVAESTRSLYSREWKVSWSKALRIYPRLEGAWRVTVVWQFHT
jgi:hypothetical protein